MKHYWLVIVIILSVVLVSGSCTEVPEPTSTPAPVTPEAPALDTTPPPPITGLIMINAYDGRVNLWWEKSTAEDFDHYNVYASESEIEDVTGLTPLHQIRDAPTTNYQATGLRDGTGYYFAVTAVDKNGNENRQVSSSSIIPTPMPAGTKDPDLQVDVYQSDKVWAGTTLLPDNHNLQKPRIIEVNMRGEIVWEYLVPQDLKQYTNPGFDAELLPNNNILFLLPGRGVYEIDREGRIVWSYLTKKISHDADRLPDGNTIFVFGGFDQKNDAQITEVNQKGEIAWTWHAKDHFNRAPYDSIFNEGWTHTNSVTRLPNGNTLISPRNFNFVVEVDSQGSVVRTIGEGVFESQHDPQALSNGNILVANQGRPPAGFHQAVEIDPTTGKIVWRSPAFEKGALPVRDANRLPNGNTLITGSTKIVEVTPDGDIVWQLSQKSVTFDVSTGQGRKDASRLGFYKADRIGTER